MNVYPFVRGTLESEMNLSMNSFMGEKCGLIGVIGADNAPEMCILGTGAQEHRGTDGAGVAVFNSKGEINFKGMVGKPYEVFSGYEEDMFGLKGKNAIAHNRYATTSSSEDLSCIQPIIKNSKYGELAFCQNGNIPNSEELRNRLIQNRNVGSDAFETNSDCETFAMYVATSNANSLEEAVIETVKEIPLAYSFLVMADRKLIGIRDIFGIRPLQYGSVSGKGHILASEDYFFSNLPNNITNILEVGHGQMIILEEGRRPKFETFSKSDLHFCSLEIMYFSSALSRSLGVYNEEYRQELGEEIFRINNDWIPTENSIVSAIPESGIDFAIGFAEASEIPYKRALRKLINPLRPNRSFIAKNKAEQQKIAYDKLKSMPKAIRGKDVLLFDDSIVRGNTAGKAIERVRMHGPKSVHLFSSAPVIRKGCDFGVNIRGTEELVITLAKSEAAIARYIGADSVTYMPYESMERTFSKVSGITICGACQDGRDPRESEIRWI